MRVLFTIGNAHFPQIFGGIQSSTDQLARRLRAAGNEVAVGCRLWDGERREWRSRLTEFMSRVQRRITGQKFSRDRMVGYPVYRAWDAMDMTEVVIRFRPDVTLVQQGPGMIELSRGLAAQAIPLVIYLRDAELGQIDGNPAELTTAHFIANSQFNARKYLDAFGIHSTVIPPLVETSVYATSTTRENVTFINPDPKKGENLALDIAGLNPDIPFTFVESWPLPNDKRAELMARLATLPNVTFRPRTNDMKSVYGKARILLAPSQWEEAWGRVASEAHCSGIPVLGSDRGGLPEAIGPGGITLPHDAPAGDWAAALRRMWNDKAEYDRLSQAARDFSRRPEMNPDYQFSLFMGVLEQAVAAACAPS